MENGRKENSLKKQLVELGFNESGQLSTVAIGEGTHWGKINLTLMDYVPEGGDLKMRMNEDNLPGKVVEIAGRRAVMYDALIERGNLVLVTQKP